MVFLRKMIWVVIDITLLIFACSCSNSDTRTGKWAYETIVLSDSLPQDTAIEKYILPFRAHLDRSLNIPLSYSTISYDKSDGQWETYIGNLLADLCMEQASPVFLSRVGEKIDFCLLNHGGIRAPISEGPITERTAYEVMPFENNLVVAKLTSERVAELIKYLINAKKPHPVSGISVVWDKDGNLISTTIQGLPLRPGSTYNVLTSDYLQNGGDAMVFLTDPIRLVPLDYKVRNAMIDYFSKVDTLPKVLDGRMRQEAEIQ